MKIGIMQPYFFPYLGYWQLINAVDKYVVYDDVNYIKGGWISRNNILLNGEKHLVTLPLEGASPNKKINEVMVTSNEKVIEKFLRIIQSAYAKAPYFKDVYSMVEKLIEVSCPISELNYYSIIRVCDYLNIQTTILLSSELEKNNGLKGQDKVIDIVKRLGGDTYYNAIGGKELYDATVFQTNQIDLKFLRMGDIRYKQFVNDFVPALSIIDILMFNSKSDIQDMLEQYTLE